MNKEKKYHIIFVNRLIKDVSYEEARSKLISTLMISEKTSDKLFSSKTARLSKTDILQNANKAVRIIKEIGFEAKVMTRKAKATSQISASAQLPPAPAIEQNISRHIDSLKPRAQQLKEKIAMFNPAHNAAEKQDARNKMPPVPDNIDDYLNEQQQSTIRQMKRIGWSLFFVRRSNPSDPVTVMMLPMSGETAKIERSGAFNMHHEVAIRH